MTAAAFALPAVAAAFAVAVCVWSAVGAVRRRGLGAQAGAAVGLGVVGLWCVRYLALRAETHHLVPAGLVVGIVAAVVPPGTLVGTMRHVRRAWLVFATVAVLVPLSGSGLARVSHLAGRRADVTVGVGDLLPRATTLHLSPRDGREWIDVVRRVRDVLPPGANLLSACARHDRIQDQDLLLYFAAGRLPPVYDYHFDPGVTTRVDVQAGIVRDAERADVRVVVLYDARPAAPPAGTPEGARVLDDWISARFPHAERIGRYEIRTQ